MISQVAIPALIARSKVGTEPCLVSTMIGASDKADRIAQLGNYACDTPEIMMKLGT